MTYSAEKSRLSKEPFVIVEEDLDECANEYGVSPCTAGIQSTGTAQAGASTTITLASGDSATDDIYNTMTVRITSGTGSGQERKITDYVGSTKVATVSVAWDTNPDNTSVYAVIDRPNACYKQYGNCQDRTNYVKTTKTFKFCTKSANAPLDQGFIPCITQHPTTTPSKIIPGKSLGTRTVVDIRMQDFPHHDRGFDPYFEDRTWYPNADQRGTFFGKFHARNKYYQSRDCRVKFGFISPDGFSEDDFVTHYYVIEEMNGPDANDMVTHRFNDVLKKTNYDRAQCPMASQGKLSADILAAAGSLTLTPAGIGNSEYPASGYVSVDSETMAFTRVADVLTLTRAQYGTTAADHTAGATVQLGYAPVAKNVIDVVYEILVDYAGIDSALIPYADWIQEKTDYLSIYNLTTIVHEPTGVSTLLNELVVECGLLIAWDEQNQEIMLKAVRSGTTASVINDGKIIKGSFSVKDKPNERLSQIWYHYDWKTPFDRSELQDFNSTNIYADAESESANKYGETRQEKIYSRWVTATGIVAEVASRRLKRYKDNPKYIETQIDIKDAVKIGDYIGIESDRNQDESGDAGLEGYQVISVKNIDKYSKQHLELMFQPFNRYGLIGPDSLPDYTSATQVQKDTYAWICDTSTLLMSNGDDPYVIQ